MFATLVSVAITLWLVLFTLALGPIASLIWWGLMTAEMLVVALAGGRVPLPR